MRVKILHQSWSVGGAVRFEGEEFETDDPNIIAYAIGILTLRRPRQTSDGQRVFGDHRACQALTEATPEERAAAEEHVASRQPVARGLLRDDAAKSLKLDPESLRELGAAIAQGLVAGGVAAPDPAKTKR